MADKSDLKNQIDQKSNNSRSEASLEQKVSDGEASKGEDEKLLNELESDQLKQIDMKGTP